MGIAVLAACEAAAWAFAGVLLALGLFYFFGRVTVPMGDFAALAAAHALIAAVTALVVVAALVRGRFPGKRPVVGATRGAAIGALVVVIVSTVSAFLYPGSGGLLYSICGQLFWSVMVAGGPFAVAGALLGRWTDRRLFGSRDA
jgi:FtsH-binding integral membrane protein